MFFKNSDTLDKTRVFWGLKRCRFIFFIVKRARLSSAAGCDYCCFWTRKKVNFMCILRINNCGKKQMWNKSCIVIEIPKIWKISPNGNLTVTSKNGWKGAFGQDQSTTVNYLSLRYQSLTCFRCFEVHLLEDNPVLDEERRWCSTSIIMSLWLMTEKRTFCYYCKRACGYCKNPWKNELKKERFWIVIIPYLITLLFYKEDQNDFFSNEKLFMNFCWSIRREKKGGSVLQPVFGALIMHWKNMCLLSPYFSKFRAAS